MTDNRIPKIKKEPYVSNNPRAIESPGRTDHLTPSWRFSLIDHDHELWGWDKIKDSELMSIIKTHLKSFEKLTWAAIKATKHHHHEIELKKFSRDAKKRLEDLKLEDTDSLFSLRLASTIRLYGIRDGSIYKIIWHDPHHKWGDPKSAYPLDSKS